MYTFILIALIPMLGVALFPFLIRRVYRAPRISEHGSPSKLGLPYCTVRIQTENDKQLFAWLIPAPQSATRSPAVAVIHGWGGNAEDMLPFAALFHHGGYATLLLDARNHGNSDSDDFSSMPRFAEDLEHGLEWLGRQPGIDPQRLWLLGHSVGAGAALLVAARRQDLAGTISIAAFAHPSEILGRQMRSHHIPHVPIGWLVKRYIEWTINVSFDRIAPRNTIRQISCPVLLVHGEEDTSVPPMDAWQIYANRLDERVELLMLPDTGHDSSEAIATHGEVLLSFLRRSVSSAPDSKD